MKQLANYLEISTKDLKGMIKIVFLAVLALSVKPMASVIGFGLTLLICILLGAVTVMVGKN